MSLPSSSSSVSHCVTQNQYQWRDIGSDGLIVDIPLCRKKWAFGVRTVYIVWFFILLFFICFVS